MHRIRIRLHHRPSTLLFYAAILLGSGLLMFHTFSYHAPTSTMEIAVKCWSDFGAHIPLIRSFSMGANLNRLLSLRAPEYPIYPGEPIRYHFLFYLIVGVLERIGFRIDWALNIPSVIGFAGLLGAIAYLSYRLFHSRKEAALSVVLFVLNGTFAFLQFLEKHPVSWETPRQILENTAFPAFGPWDNGLVSAFWNLNIYTNQRHLALGFLLGLVFISISYVQRATPLKRQLSALFILVPILVALPYLHQPMLVMLAIYMIWFFLIYKRLRILLFLTGLIALMPIYLQIRPLLGGASEFAWYPGYLIHERLTPALFLQYWLYNFGLHTVLIPLGLLFSPKHVRLLMVPLLAIFIMANCFKFSVEVAANHKFFNFIMIFGVILTSHAIGTLWRMLNLHAHRRMRIGPLAVRHPVLDIIRLEIVAVVFFLTLSGFMDLMVIINDHTISLEDIPKNETAQWIVDHTPPDAIFLNSSYLYHPASLAGRSIFLGWPYFPWSAGYPDNRMPIMDTMYESHDPAVFCPLFDQYNITFITVEHVMDDGNLPDINPAYFRDLGQPAFETHEGRYAIYERDALCPDTK